MSTALDESESGRQTRQTRHTYTLQDPKMPRKSVQAPLPGKTVTFPLLLSAGTQHQARLPLRVKVHTHDTTESIISTVKNFYGLYEGQGVAFEDAEGLTIIPRYENLSDHDSVLVRITREQEAPGESFQRSTFHTHHDDATSAPPPSSIALDMHSFPPMSRSHYSSQTQSPVPSVDSHAPGFTDGHWKPDDTGAATDDDVTNASVSSSRRAKSDNVASADISVDNILDGHRRKRAKFESSELPLFIPQQMAAAHSISSASPRHQLANPGVPSPIPNKSLNGQYFYALPSPQSHAQSDYSPVKIRHASTTTPSHNLGKNPLATAPPSHRSAGANSMVLPTPDPTIPGSNISDEDVALQLMRLGDASNLSYGRTSNSTVDDALSGKAEVASSDEETDEEEVNSLPRLSPETSKAFAPPKKKVKGFLNTLYLGDGADHIDDHSGDYGASQKKRKKPSTAKTPVSATSSNQAASRKTAAPKSQKGTQPSPAKMPASPFSAFQTQRKTSNASSANVRTEFGSDEEDLSAKPRCQRCRKSKKGCDRQRPCQRCKDAGVGIEGCISEDEGNGRKGRYGRIMGVPVKKNDGSIDGTAQQPSPAPSVASVDPSKKRKR